MPLTLDQLRTPITREQALQTLLDEAQSLGFSSSSWQSGSVQRTLLTLVAEVWSQLSEFVDAVSRFAFNDSSTGDALTAFSDSHYDNQRVEAVQTVGTVRLTGGAVGPPHVVAIGQLVVSDSVNGYTYRNTTAGTVPVSGTVDLTFQAEVAGLSRNVANNTITTMNTALAGVTCNNPPLPSGTWITTLGVDEEADSVLQTRNRAKWGVLAYDTPAAGYEYMALTADTDIARVGVDDSNPRGPGTINVYIARATGIATGADVSTVQAYINDHKACSADVLVAASTAQAQNLTATVHVTAALNTTTKQAEIKQAAYDYINSLAIGGEVLPGGTAGYLIYSELVGACTAVEGVRRIVFSAPAAADVAVTAWRVVTVGAEAWTFVSI
jgi:hypothetical protein